MPRIHGPGRGSRYPKGVHSATTLSTIPSGVTIDYNSGVTSDRPFLFPSGQIGDGTNFTSFETNGIIKFNGDATVWDDERVPLYKAKAGGAGVPDFDPLKGGLLAYNFDDGDQLYFSIQMSHSWKVGSTIYPHVHVIPEANGAPSSSIIGLEYSWTSLDDYSTRNTPITVTAALSILASDASKHLYLDLPSYADSVGATWSGVTPGISGGTQVISSIINCRIFRGAAAANNYGSSIFILEFDIHYKKDTFGSRKKLEK